MLENSNSTEEELDGYPSIQQVSSPRFVFDKWLDILLKLVNLYLVKTRKFVYQVKYSTLQCCQYISTAREDSMIHAHPQTLYRILN